MKIIYGSIALLFFGILCLAIWLYYNKTYIYVYTTCENLTCEKAQELLKSWHLNLDRDNDWIACESSCKY